jgi:hypothetical protein
MSVLTILIWVLVKVSDNQAFTMMSVYGQAITMICIMINSISSRKFQRSNNIIFVMVHRFASTEGVVPEPICLLCGVEIHTTDNLGIPRSIEGASRLDKQHWKRLWKPDPGHFLISSHEVENAYIDRFPLLWSCLYRARKLVNFLQSIPVF